MTNSFISRDALSTYTTIKGGGNLVKYITYQMWSQNVAGCFQGVLSRKIHSFSSKAKSQRKGLSIRQDNTGGKIMESAHNNLSQ